MDTNIKNRLDFYVQMEILWDDLNRIKMNTVDKRTNISKKLSENDIKLLDEIIKLLHERLSKQKKELIYI